MFRWTPGFGSGWKVGQRLGLLGRQIQAPSDRPSSGKFGDEGEDLPTASVRSGRRRAVLAQASTP